jgi:hypothetical protein
MPSQRWRYRARAAGLWLLLSAVQGRAEVAVLGRVIDENGAAVAGARIEVEGLRALASDPAGRFRVSFTSPGDYFFSAECEGFFALRRQQVHISEGQNEVTLILNHQREFAERVDVVYSPPVIDVEQPAAQQKLTGMEILEVPFANAQDFRQALPMFQGVVQDAGGNIHIQGGGADQTYWTLNGFNITDPVTGGLDTRLSIDALRAIDLQTSRYSAETGKGSAGSVDLKTDMGDDRFRFSATNFVPGLENHKGFVLSKWTPRATVSGPIWKGRAWFSNGFDTFYDLNIVDELPAGRDRTSSWRTSNITRGQVNIRPNNILTGSFLLNYLNAPRDGLNYFNPMETTVDRRHRLYLFTLKDQIFFGSGGLAEVGVGSSRAFQRGIPQGGATFVFSPEGQLGNYFVDSKVHSHREQYLANFYAPPFDGWGRHQIKAGLDADRSAFSKSVHRHAYQVHREDKSVARTVTFSGANNFGRKNFETALYVQDNWAPLAGIVIEGGIRADWDQLVRDPLVSPRLAMAYAPKWSSGTKFSAGAGIFHDALNLSMLSRQLDQTSTSYFFNRNGQITSGPVETFFLVNERRLRAPRYRNFSVGAERGLGAGFYGRLQYADRLGTRGFTFLPMPPVPGQNRFGLFNARRDHYRALELTVRKTFHGQYEWLAGYTRSAARSNAVLDFNLENPVFAQQSGGPLAWDAPNRFQTWGWAPLPVPARWPPVFRKFSVAYWLEARTGFPFQVVNEEGQLVGPANGRRFPAFFSVNLHLERRFTLLHQEWAWRAGFNNIFNHQNPNVVNNNIDSPGYLTYAGGQRRAFTVRLRFLGKT